MQHPKKIQGFNYRSRAGLYKNHSGSNTFNPDTLEARSYDWWVYVAKIGKELVFNDYNYSATTIKHQANMKSLLRELGFKITMTVHAPRGLDKLDSAIEHYIYEKNNLAALMAKPRTHKAKNLERKAKIESLNAKIQEVKYLKSLKGGSNE